MNKELRKKLAIDEYLELIKDDKNLNMAYTSLAQYMYILEQQLKEKDKIIDEIKTYINSQMNSYEDDGDFGVDCCCDGFKLLEILQRGKNDK